MIECLNKNGQVNRVQEETMRNMHQQGKITLVGLIMVFLLIWGGIAIFKLASSSMTKKQIQEEVFDAVRSMRDSGDFSENKAATAIAGILDQNGIDLETASVNVKRSSGQISYDVVYELETDFLLFKKNEQVEISKAVPAI